MKMEEVKKEALVMLFKAMIFACPLLIASLIAFYSEPFNKAGITNDTIGYIMFIGYGLAILLALRNLSGVGLIEKH